jgi:hypothetical protein
MAARKEVRKRRNKPATPKTRVRSKKPKDAKIRELIEKVVAHGIFEMIADDPGLKKSFLKRLNFTPASLKVLDAVIKSIWGGERPSDQNFDAMVWAFGAYVAEVIHRNNEGYWAKSKAHYDFHCTTDGKPTGFAVSPWSWVYKRFDEDDMLATKYKGVMKIADSFSEASVN